jgi:hypothetical protein
MVEYSNARGLAFAIGAGRTETVLTYQSSDDPPYFTSRGIARPPIREIAFAYAREETPYPGFSAVSIGDGIRALEYFLDCGERSSAIDWERL